MPEEADLDILPLANDWEADYTTVTQSNLLIFGQEGRFQWSLSSANQLTTTGGIHNHQVIRIRSITNQPIISASPYWQKQYYQHSQGPGSILNHQRAGEREKGSMQNACWSIRTMKSLWEAGGGRIEYRGDWLVSGVYNRGRNGVTLMMGILC